MDDEDDDDTQICSVYCQDILPEIFVHLFGRKQKLQLSKLKSAIL